MKILKINNTYPLLGHLLCEFANDLKRPEIASMKSTYNNLYVRRHINEWLIVICELSDVWRRYI